MLKGTKLSMRVMSIRWVGSLGGLWQQATHLERFYRQAFRGVEADGRDRLAENLRLIARDSRVSERVPGKERFGRVDGEEGFSLSLEKGRGERLPVPGDLWPPSPGDEPIPIIWPPDGGETPGLPSDFCELVQDACRTMVLGGAASITMPLPVSTYADGIRWIMPATACAGETITIHGSGFGVSRPENVNVIIGGMVAEVVSWSDTEIVIKVPGGAASGCVGFRNQTIEGGRFSQYLQNQRAMGEISEGLSCLGKGAKWPH